MPCVFMNVTIVGGGGQNKTKTTTTIQTVGHILIIHQYKSFWVYIVIIPQHIKKHGDIINILSVDLPHSKNWNIFCP